MKAFTNKQGRKCFRKEAVSLKAYLSFQLLSSQSPFAHISFFIFLVFWHFYCICHSDFWSGHCSFCRHQSQKLIYMVQHSSLWHPSEISRNTTAMCCVLVVSRPELSGDRRGCYLIFVRYSVCLVMFRRDRLLYFLYAVGWKAAFYPAHRKWFVLLVMKMSEFLPKINSFLFFMARRWILWSFDPLGSIVWHIDRMG